MQTTPGTAKNSARHGTFAAMKTKNYPFLIVCLVLLPGIFSCGNGSQQDPQQTTAAAGIPAIEQLTKKIETSPNDASLYAARGAIWYENQGFDEGIADVEKAISLDSTKPEYFHALADMYLDYFKSRLALNTMQRAAAAFPRRIPTLLKLAEFQFILQQHTEALVTLERIRQMDPQNAEMFFMFGRVFKEMGKTEQAINAFQSAAENDATLTDAWVNLGELVAGKNPEAAGRYFDNALRVDSTNIAALHAKAYFLSNRKNDLAGAVLLYKKINAIDPQYEDGFYNLGLLYLDMDSLEQARKSFDIAIQVAPTFANAYYYRGVTHEKLGDKAKAQADFDNAKRLKPAE